MQEVIKRRLEEIELLSQDLLEVGTTKWEALFNPQKIDLGNISAEVILELEKFWRLRKLKLILIFQLIYQVYLQIKEE